MQSIRNSILGRLRVRVCMKEFFPVKDVKAISSFCQQFSTAASSNPDQILARVIGLVKKFDRIDSSKVIETADFQKDLSLDSLDRVELVMAFEEEFSIEIPEEKADNLKCCADVAKYIASEADQKTSEDS